MSRKLTMKQDLALLATIKNKGLMSVLKKDMANLNRLKRKGYVTEAQVLANYETLLTVLAG